MEEKLAHYRKQKISQHKEQDGTTYFGNISSVYQRITRHSNETSVTSQADKSHPQSATDDANTTTTTIPQRPAHIEHHHQAYKQRMQAKNMSRLSLALRVALWLVLLGFFIETGFGLAYFVISMFYWIYVSMSIRNRSTDEPSAYSVFNKNCERIDGTFTAEQFEKQLRGGAGLL